MIPEGHEIGYECRNGHVNEKHDVTLDGDYRGNKRPACVECGDKLTRTLIPLRACNDCENVWAYTGGADRPTCPNCQGKRTEPVGE